jgi:hypothetical protein
MDGGVVHPELDDHFNLDPLSLAILFVQYMVNYIFLDEFI